MRGYSKYVVIAGTNVIDVLLRSKDESVGGESGIQFPLAADDAEDCDDSEAILLEGSCAHARQPTCA